MLVRKRGESASSGTGTRISTLFAVERRLNWARAYGKAASEGLRRGVEWNDGSLG